LKSALFQNFFNYPRKRPGFDRVEGKLRIESSLRLKEGKLSSGTILIEGLLLFVWQRYISRRRGVVEKGSGTQRWSHLDATPSL